VKKGRLKPREKKTGHQHGGKDALREKSESSRRRGRGEGKVTGELWKMENCTRPRDSSEKRVYLEEGSEGTVLGMAT